MRTTLRAFLLIFLNLVFLLPANSQNAVIGNGAASSMGSGPTFTGGNANEKYSKQCAIYRASEIKAQNIFSGVLTSISWYKDNTESYPHNDATFKIYVKHTAQTAYPASSVNWDNEVIGATLVYSSNTQGFSPATGWQDFLLSIPFTWNGNDNLEILVDFYNPTPITAGITWRWTGLSNTTAISSDFAPFSTVYRNALRPNVTLAFSTTPTNDAGVSAIFAPVSPVIPGASQPVQVTLRNYGGSALTSALINWRVDGVLQPAFAWSGNLAPAQTTLPVSIGTYSFLPGSHSLCAWTSLPNNGPDANPLNDSSCTVLASCSPMAGNYTVNSGQPASLINFTSFTDAFLQLNECGISGPVTLSAAPGSGPYSGLLELKTIGGATQNNLLTIQGNGVTLTGTPTASSPAIITLNGTKYTTITDFKLTVSGTAGGGIRLINQSEYNTISNCALTLPVNGSYNNWVGILAGTYNNTSGNYASNCSFLNNSITGGYRGIMLTGTTGGLNANNNRVAGNQIRDFIYQGIVLENTNGTIVSGNDISRPTLSAGGFNGITLSYGNRNCTITGNRIHNSHGSGANPQTLAYGIDLQLCDAPAGQENIISNNLIYDFNNAGTKFPLVCNGSDGAYFYHNTVYLKTSVLPTGTAYGFDMSQASNVKLLNNIFSFSLPGTTGKYAIHLATNSQLLSDYNLFYFDPANAVNAYIASDNNTNYASLANWQTARTNAFDQNILALDPKFANAAQFDFVPTNGAVTAAGTALPTVTTDFYGNPRSATNPTPGAFEFGSVSGLPDAFAVAFPVMAWPNPFTANLKLRLNPEKAGTLNMIIYDALGRTVYQTSEKINSGNKTLEIPLAHLPKGFYVLKLTQNGRESQQKLIKQ